MRRKIGPIPLLGLSSPILITMEPLTTSTNSSSACTDSSALSSPHHKQGGGASRIRSAAETATSPRTSQLQDSNTWTDVDDIVSLGVDDDDSPMSEEDIADPRHFVETSDIPLNAQSTIGEDLLTQSREQTSGVSTLFQHWIRNDDEVKSSDPDHAYSGAYEGSIASTGQPMRENLESVHHGFAPHWFKTKARWVDNGNHTYLPSAVRLEHQSLLNSTNSTERANLCQTLTFKKQRNGLPFPLSKPLLRDDGHVVVGTELISTGNRSDEVENCIFVTNLKAYHPSQPLECVRTTAEIRDLQWIGRSSVLAAIGSDLHMVHLDDALPGVAPSCSLSAPLRRVHSDTIRELAVATHPRHGIMFASGGFDETVVVTTLGEGGEPSILGKIDAYDVVSSVRWHPTSPGRLSWTTDGGDFQIADVRAGSKPQLKPASFKVRSMGALFCHEYVSSTSVVLGFDKGHVLLYDLRMARNVEPHSVKVPLPAVGDILSADSGFCAMFGVGGFVSAMFASSGDSFVGMTSVRPPHSFQLDPNKYKTNGALSVGTGAMLGVSDNLGTVSIYSMDNFSQALPQLSTACRGNAE